MTCVTAACIAVRAEVFRTRGVFDKASRSPATTSVNVFGRDPLVHHLGHWRLSSFIANWPRSAARTRGRLLSSIKLMRQRWGPLLKADPFYNRNLGLERGYSLAFPPRRITCSKSRAG